MEICQFASIREGLDEIYPETPKKKKQKGRNRETGFISEVSLCF
jgi:hypothetical protein